MTGDAEIDKFQITVWQYYAEHGRYELPWRLPDQVGGFDPYRVMVSEVMLQQTQVNRVIPKYLEFIEHFPTLHDLAAAPQANIIMAWAGLGYNRRAKFLSQAARLVEQSFQGNFPDELTELVKLPGIGPNTAAAIIAYSYDRPVTFIETNIRTVFIYHFFEGTIAVADKAILELVQQSLPTQNFRQWYWALMDYGSYLKATVGNLNKLSKHYVKQAPFVGSRRQVRGQILKSLSMNRQTVEQLSQIIHDERLRSVLSDLTAEKLIKMSQDGYELYERDMLE